MFTPGGAGFRAGRRVAGAVERAGRGGKRLFHALEHASKALAYDCRDCGDCSLPDVAFLCPESQCVKNQRNGPCGGTREGKCEVGEKECIWARAYDRLKAYGEERTLCDGPAIVKNAALQGTSAWLNTYLERDHFADRRRAAPERPAAKDEPDA